MEDALHYFHSFKDVFLLGRAANMTKAKPNALRTELVKKPKVDKCNTGRSTLSPNQ